MTCLPIVYREFERRQKVGIIHTFPPFIPFTIDTAFLLVRSSHSRRAINLGFR